MNRFTLDTVIEDEGGNLSVGQVSQLLYEGYATLNVLCLFRIKFITAFVGFPGSCPCQERQGHHPRRGDRYDGPSSSFTFMIFADHLSRPAPASVDYETDRKIQDTIAQEFHDRTILCIARE